MKAFKYVLSHKRVVLLVLCIVLIAVGVKMALDYRHNHPPGVVIDTTFDSRLSDKDRALYEATRVLDPNGNTDETKKASAYKALDQAIKDAKTTDDKFTALTQKAGFCYQQKDQQCAADNYAEAYKLNSKAWDIAWNAAMAYESLNDKARALEYYKLAANGASDEDNGNGSPKSQINTKITELSK